MNSNGANYIRYADRGVAELNIVGASYGAGGQGTRIAYVNVPCELGLILIGATAHGICWLGIHRNAAYLESELRRDFPKAEIDHDDDALQELASHVIRLIVNPAPTLDLPIDVRATRFQLAVWRELCAIPRGATRSYHEIAYRLGKPGAARAVGRANGSNPLAVVIPCHRAIGSDGNLTGYRWGLEYKRRLLDYERVLNGKSSQ
jgi:AraC family transcriptional regulator, regulatory protein of adaptative response / methylated-DNA-[protein]-cysteine methyltransferase